MLLSGVNVETLGEPVIKCGKYQCLFSISLGTDTIYLANITTAEEIETLNFIPVRFNKKMHDIVMVPDIKEPKRSTLIIKVDYPQGSKIVSTKQTMIASSFSIGGDSFWAILRDCPEIYLMKSFVFSMIMKYPDGEYHEVWFSIDSNGVNKNDSVVPKDKQPEQKTNSFIATHNGKRCNTKFNVNGNNVIFVNPYVVAKSEKKSVTQYLQWYFRCGVLPDAAIWTANTADSVIEQLDKMNEKNLTLWLSRYVFIGYSYYDTIRIRRYIDGKISKIMDWQITQP